ncbi:hypothetical protein CAP35_01815 [Chitinophagaceae bacterium IBVUCB1]|nr:hypothetical protein CAP35_01815 [Chitinophagaceae bacterium IBVUCB1]
MNKLSRISLLLLGFVVWCNHTVAVPAYNSLPFVVKPDAAANNRQFDSLMHEHPMMSSQVVINAVEAPRYFNNKTVDFYILVAICIFLGIIRYTNNRYFTNLWSVFRSPSYSSASREQLETAGISNTLMNLLFFMVVGMFMYYLVKIYSPVTAGNINPLLLMLSMMGGLAAIYTGKYIAVRFGGWAFKLDSVSEGYLFNIFLINKVLAVILLPFVFFLAFADAVYKGPVLIVAAILISLLFVSRYLRSWQVFGSFFQYSKFHFFTYLCASEILPLAVLMKLLVKMLLY